MADVAHDASCQASPKPGDIAPQQASRPESPDRGKLRIFISYSREDLHFADQLDAALNACGFECIIDRHISGGEDWKQRLGNLISEADTVVFVLSPSSARSEVCAWEGEEAARLNKRILPVICRPLEGASPPPQLRERNYIFFYEEAKVSGAGFGSGLAKLIAALNSDFDWLREHTRYLQRATEWDKGGRAANRLLSGNDIAEAKAWAARQPKSAPEPTALHLDFIRESEEEAEARSSAQRKQLEEMAAAQAEREKALHEAEEALNQAADAQRRRARIRNIAFAVVSILAMLAGWLYWRAEHQRNVAEEQRAVAEEQREQADRILTGARNIIVKLQDQMDADAKKEVVALFQTGADHGDAPSMRNLGIIYHRGFGVAQDYAAARAWYEKAADKGDAEAMVNLGLLYQNGDGVAQNHAKAREWYEKAADKENASAKALLERLPVVEAFVEEARRLAANQPSEQPPVVEATRGLAAEQPSEQPPLVEAAGGPADEIMKALLPPRLRLRSGEGADRAANLRADEASFINSLRNRPTRSLTTPEREQIASIAESRPRIDVKVDFEFNSDAIGPKATPQVTALGKALSSADLKGGTFIVAGHTDAKGSERYTQDLSERRADAVKRFLSGKYGIDESNLVTVGYGKTKPKAPWDPLGRENQRIQVINVSDK